MSKQVPYFGCTKPCKSCPYRTDAPLAHWHKDHFEKLLIDDQDPLSSIYLCHKNNGGACIGWLIDQDKRRFPSIMLRLQLSRDNITREYLDKLRSPVPLYQSIKEMIKQNFPALIK